MPRPKTGSAQLYGAAILIALATLGAYLPSLGNGFVNWDDSIYFLDNSRIRSLDAGFLKWVFLHVVNSNWHPLTMISYAVDYSLWGYDPRGWHLVNIVFHALNTFLVFFLAFRLVSLRATEGSSVPFVAAVFTAVLFGLHPVHVESVSWVSERKDVLCGFFFVLTLLAYLRYAGKDSEGGAFYYALALVLFALALLSKPMAVTLPVVLLILDYYPLERLNGENALRRLLEKAPFFFLAVLSAALTVYAQASSGAFMTFENYPLVMRVFVSVRSFIFYLYKMAFPLWLSPCYPPPMKASLLNAGFIASLVLIAAITVFTVRRAKRNRSMLACWLFYVVTLLPVSGILQVGGQAAADRYTYIPGLAPFLLLGVGAGVLIERRFRVILPAALLITGLLAAKTVTQQAVWKDSVTLWTTAIDQYPMSVPLIYNNRGLAYRKLKDYPAALADFDRALSINPGFYYSYVNRGLVRGDMSEFDAAIADFGRAVSLKPDYAEAYYYRAIAEFNKGLFPEVFADLTEAIKLKPGYADAYSKRGLAHYSLGHYESALEDFSKAASLEPANGAVFYNLGLAASKAGADATAAESFKRARELGYKR
ncbi:MAG TPA: tetratricopeptide repeat protein [Thermodesulfobacteriota bacterium]|nr:tetratricopeptide repeat protein [Thermodesulfobacteriota bacterium]